MKAVRAVYNKGKVKFAEKPAEVGPVEVLVVFPEDDDSWKEILSERKPRAEFLAFAQQCEEAIKQGKSKPLRLEDL
jgi:hypothetical protein